MPAPTALLKREENPAAPIDVPLPHPDQDEEQILDAPPTVVPENVADVDTEMRVDEELRPKFSAAKDVDPLVRRETRKVPIPPHRMSPLKSSWPKIYTPVCTLSICIAIGNRHADRDVP